ncbi:hypothetical protein [Dyadobacter sp. NIV53]|uniref:hypothetical protein n=1 Tax=Dyadobacter sp. NIV53 TaxID=2861765 RepID=UPI001C879A35|nr:hypothetical protein [Dyadobacter sp. NIV53]
MSGRNVYTLLTKIFLIFAVAWFSGCKPGNDTDRTWSVYKADVSSSKYLLLDEIEISDVGQFKLDFGIYNAALAGVINANACRYRVKEPQYPTGPVTSSMKNLFGII